MAASACPTHRGRSLHGVGSFEQFTAQPLHGNFLAPQLAPNSTTGRDEQVLGGLASARSANKTNKTIWTGMARDWKDSKICISRPVP